MPRPGRNPASAASQGCLRHQHFTKLCPGVAGPQSDTAISPTDLCDILTRSPDQPILAPLCQPRYIGNAAVVDRWFRGCLSSDVSSPVPCGCGCESRGAAHHLVAAPTALGVSSSSSNKYALGKTVFRKKPSATPAPSSSTTDDDDSTHTDELWCLDGMHRLMTGSLFLAAIRNLAQSERRFTAHSTDSAVLDAVILRLEEHLVRPSIDSSIDTAATAWVGRHRRSATACDDRCAASGSAGHTVDPPSFLRLLPSAVDRLAYVEALLIPPLDSIPAQAVGDPTSMEGVRMMFERLAHSYVGRWVKDAQTSNLSSFASGNTPTSTAPSALAMLTEKALRGCFSLVGDVRNDDVLIGEVFHWTQETTLLTVRPPPPPTSALIAAYPNAAGLNNHTKATTTAAMPAAPVPSSASDDEGRPACSLADLTRNLLFAPFMDDPWMDQEIRFAASPFHYDGGGAAAARQQSALEAVLVTEVMPAASSVSSSSTYVSPFESFIKSFVQSTLPKLAGAPSEQSRLKVLLQYASVYSVYEGRCRVAKGGLPHLSTTSSISSSSSSSDATGDAAALVERTEAERFTRELLALM